MSGVFLDFPSVGTLLGIIHAIYLVAFLFSLRGKALSFKVLSALLLAMAIGLLGSIMNSKGLFSSNPVLAFLFSANEFLYGPLFYLYVRKMVKPDSEWKTGSFYHFVPAISFLLISLSSVVAHFPLHGWVYGILLKTGISLQVGIYLYLSIKVWKKHALALKDYFSAIEEKRMNWLRNVIMGMCGVFLMSLFSFIFSSPVIFNLAPLAGALLIYTASYLGMKNSSVFSTPGGPNLLPEQDVEKPERNKYQHSGLSLQKQAEIENQITEIMEREKLFKDNELTLPKLAEKLEISTHHLSQVLNQKMGKTFFDLVNEYRVKEVQRLIKNPDYKHYTLLGLGVEAGFNSKSAFNATFKKYLKQTPLQYRNSLEKEKK